MQAKRIRNFSEIIPNVICYWKHEETGNWYINFDDEFDTLGGLANHKVEEHEDGTITVSPSIKTWNDRIIRHGFLKRGVWKPCEDDKTFPK